MISTNKNSFHELLKQTRLDADQTVEVMSILLNMTSEEYMALESWKYPDEDTLKRLCMMMEWNYYDARRLIINEMISPHRPAAVEPEEEQRNLERGTRGTAARGAPPGISAGHNSLGARLREVRMITGQSTDIIALMLNVDEEEYKQLEDGMQPPDEVLRRISLVYNWNYQDLISVLRAEHAKSFQPSRVGMPFLGSNAHTARYRQINQEMEGLFMKLSDTDQRSILAQLELVRETMLRQQKAS